MLDNFSDLPDMPEMRDEEADSFERLFIAGCWMTLALGGALIAFVVVMSR